MAEATSTEKKEAKKKFAPKVNVKSAGRISATLEGIADDYRRQYPDREVRWVYHSATKPELSNVMSRRAEGYDLVKPDEFTESITASSFTDEKGLIRVADVVLMSILAGQREANRAARQDMASDQLASVKDNYDASMGSARSGRHRATARGAVKLEPKDHEYEIEQRSRED